MSVLIKGFELPENCAECQFSDVFAYPPDYDDEWICELNYLSMTWEDAQMRHANCPLSEVSTPHGRLIDADEMLQFLVDTFGEEIKAGFAWKTISEHCITIIEAEESE